MGPAVHGANVASTGLKDEARRRDIMWGVWLGGIGLGHKGKRTGTESPLSKTGDFALATWRDN